MRFKRPPSFDPQADLAAIARLASAWRSQFRPAAVSYTPSFLLAQLEELEQASSYRLYLVTRPQEPAPLAILEELDRQAVLELMALAPNSGEDLARPLSASPQERKQMMRKAPEEPSGRGVFAFLLGREGGAAWLDLEPEALVVVMARWGELNLLDPAPLVAARLKLLGQRLAQLAAPAGDGEAPEG